MIFSRYLFHPIWFWFSLSACCTACGEQQAMTDIPGLNTIPRRHGPTCRDGVHERKEIKKWQVYQVVQAYPDQAVWVIPPSEDLAVWHLVLTVMRSLKI